MAYVKHAAKKFTGCGHENASGGETVYAARVDPGFGCDGFAGMLDKRVTALVWSSLSGGCAGTAHGCLGRIA